MIYCLARMNDYGSPLVQLDQNKRQKNLMEQKEARKIKPFM